MAKAVVWLVLAGLFCVVLTEVLAVLLMTALPPSVDVVGNLILYVVAPVVICLALLGSILLTRSLRAVSFGAALLFPASFAGFQFLALKAMGNPTGYCLTILALTSTVSVLAVLWRRKALSSSSVSAS